MIPKSKISTFEGQFSVGAAFFATLLELLYIFYCLNRFFFFEKNSKQQQTEK